MSDDGEQLLYAAHLDGYNEAITDVRILTHQLAKNALFSQFQMLTKLNEDLHEMYLKDE